MSDLDDLFEFAGPILFSKKKRRGRGQTREGKNGLERNCSVCKIWKPILEYHKRKCPNPVIILHRNAHQSTCKTCRRNEYAKKRLKLRKLNKSNQGEV